MCKNKHFAEYRKIYFTVFAKYRKIYFHVFAEYRKICFAVFAEYRKIFQPNSTTNRSQIPQQNTAKRHNKIGISQPNATTNRSQKPQNFLKIFRRKRVTCCGDIDQSTSTKKLILEKCEALNKRFGGSAQAENYKN